MDGVKAKYITKPFITSWVGEAAQADRFGASFAVRKAGWASWVLSNLIEIETPKRQYLAFLLDGSFYSKEYTETKPHVEIQNKVLYTMDKLFPSRLAMMGNGLGTQWWHTSETISLKKALFEHGDGDVTALLEFLNTRKHLLETTLTTLHKATVAQWTDVENVMVEKPEEFAELVSADFSSEEIAAYLPAAANWNLHIRFSEKLKNLNGSWVSKRLGIWQIEGKDLTKAEVKLGVVTPKVTASALLHDPLYTIANESAASLLVRGLILKRLSKTYLKYNWVNRVTVGGSSSINNVSAPKAKTTKPFLRGVAIQIENKIPEATADAAENFLENYENAREAWQALLQWAGKDKLLTVTEEQFNFAFRRAKKTLARGDKLSREDINTFLPLALNEGRSVRVTFSLPDNS